jgi:hypothetical protein
MRLQGQWPLLLACSPPPFLSPSPMTQGRACPHSLTFTSSLLSRWVAGTALDSCRARWLSACGPMSKGGGTWAWRGTKAHGGKLLCCATVRHPTHPARNAFVSIHSIAVVPFLPVVCCSPSRVLWPVVLPQWLCGVRWPRQWVVSAP